MCFEAHRPSGEGCEGHLTRFHLDLERTTCMRGLEGRSMVIPPQSFHKNDGCLFIFDRPGKPGELDQVCYGCVDRSYRLSSKTCPPLPGPEGQFSVGHVGPVSDIICEEYWKVMEADIDRMGLASVPRSTAKRTARSRLTLCRQQNSMSSS